MRQVLSICPFYRGGNWGCEQWSTMPKVTRSNMPLVRGQKHDETQGHLACLGTPLSYLRSPDTLVRYTFPWRARTFCFTFTRYTTQVAAWVWPGAGMREVVLCVFHSTTALALNPECHLSAPHTCPSSTHLAPCASTTITQPATHSALGASWTSEERILPPARLLGLLHWHLVMSLFFKR